MSAEREAVAVINKGISGNSRLFVVGAAEAAVDDNEFPAGLHRVLPFYGTDGDVAVDDVAGFVDKAEFRSKVVIALRP